MGTVPRSLGLKKENLLTPGPTPVPQATLEAMARPIIHHRTPQYQKIFEEVTASLKGIFKTKNDILTFTCSGTGAMEASVSNLLSPGDRAIVVKGGKFGERWEEICRVYGIGVEAIDVAWGEPLNPNLINEELIEKGEEIGAVFTTLCETSTGVVNDIEAIGRIVARYNAVLVVDAISGLGADDLQTDKWSVDVVVVGSQKGLMVPPGLAFVSVSPKAWERIEASRSPRYYFDFRKARKALEKFDSPFTPAVNLMVGLRESLRIIDAEGIDGVIAKNKRLAEGVRAAMKALGLELYAPTAPANAVTSVKVPDGIDGQKLVKLLRDKYGVAVAGGQAQLKGKIFRIAHMGHIGADDLVAGISALEKALVELGYNRFELATGVKAAKEVFKRSD